MSGGSRLQRQTDRVVLWCFSMLFEAAVVFLKAARRK